MGSKQITFSNEARKKIISGVNKLANTVKVTMGPKGKVVIFKKGGPIFSLDGVTVAKQINFKDEVEDIGCSLVKNIAEKTDKEAGDGTTTATLLAQVILKEGMKSIAAGVDMNKVKKGIEVGLKIATDKLKKIAKNIKTSKEVDNIATIASRDREIGEAIAGIVKKVGKDAIIAVEESRVIGLNTEIVEGMQFDKGYISPYMMTNPDRGEVVIEKPYILITSQFIKSNQEVIRILDEIIKTESKSLLIIAEDVAGEALATIVINKMRGILNIAAVKAPGYGDDKRDLMIDIATLTGGNLIAEEAGKNVEDIEMEDLGIADKIVITKDQTIIIGGKGKKSAIKKRIAEIKRISEKDDSEYLRDLAKKRLGKMKGGVAIIHVGTISEQENQEKRYRIEDAVRATMSAIEEGIVPGAGMALIECSKEIEKVIEKEKDISLRMGLDILAQAIKEPAKQIIKNAGGKPDVILENIIKSQSISTGYNSSIGNYCNLMKEGIIDPVKVVRCALENAVSVVSLFMITEAVITDEPKDDEKKQSD